MRVTWLLLKVKKLFTKKKKINNILIIDLMGIGDIVCLTPFIKALKKSNRFDSIYGCFPKVSTELSKNLVELDGYIVHESYLKTIKEVNKLNIDTIIIPGWGLRHSIIALFTRFMVLGFLNDLTFTNEYINSFMLEGVGVDSTKIPKHSYDMSKLHLAQRSNAILDYFNMKPVPNVIQYNSSSLSTTQDDYIVIHASAKYIGRRWAIERYRDVAQLILNNNYVSKVFLIGGKEDIEQYATISSGNIINLAGRQSLAETQQLLKKAKFFLGNDSGPMHIASFSEIPLFSLMGPNLPVISGSNSSLGYNFFHKQDCSPCNQKECQFNYKCINSISVDEVFNKFKRSFEAYYGKN